MKNEKASDYRNQTLDSSFNGVFLDYLTKTLYQKEQRLLDPRIKLCDEPVMSSFVVSYMRRNHFLINEVNREIEALQSNGMLGFWIKTYTSYKHTKLKSQSLPSKLKMNNLKGAFQILLCGLLFSFFYFSAEVLIFLIKAKFALR